MSRKEIEPAAPDLTVESGGGSFLDRLQQAAPVSGTHSPRPGLQLHPGTSVLDGRFSILRRIGEGGMGVVFEAYDAVRRSAVAIKTLSRLDPGGVHRLKNEFRSVADMHHPNLCRLHELFSDEGWFYSMELVEGERFNDWVRPGGRLDAQRLRAALQQMLQGVAAIHGAGMLHRDLKSSNVLVESDGRVVILDFGLVVDQHADSARRPSVEVGFSGTPGYMAPEQTLSGPKGAPTPASDLYAIGSMLFVALTDRLPFEGPVSDVLEHKRSQAAPRVHSLVPDAPDDLARLCDALLQRDPAARPDVARLRAALDGGAIAGAATRVAPWPPALPATLWDPAQTEPAGTPPVNTLLGRDGELAALHAAYASMLDGHPVVMFVSGESGMGKSALVQAFLDQVRADDRSVTLQGRCYDRESVPFKAFDAVMDELCSHLHALTREEAGDLMPREMYALARLFPVLERVGAVQRAPRKDVPDLQDLRLRAFAALSELLGRMRDRRPLVIFVDDIQWTDTDSIVVFEYLLSQPEPIPFLWVTTHRSEGAGDNALLQHFLRIPARSPKVKCHSLHVGPLPPAVSVQLAQRLFGSAGSADAAWIAAEGQGSPFFLGELVREALSGWPPGATPAALSLSLTVDRHVGMLPAQAREVLNVLAVAGRPMAAQLVLDAAHATHEALDALLFERLARTSRVSVHSRVLECYHDKIRESVADALAPDALRRIHARLAEALSAQAGSAPEHLAVHFRGAGDHARASLYYERAGDVFAAALAFEFASRQYRQCLDLLDGDAQRFRHVQVKLAAMLASMGNSREAAGVYRAASLGAAPQEALEYTRAAAHLLNTSGYIDEARVLLGEVLAGIGLSMPRSPRAAIAAALGSRFLLMCRGLKMDPTAVPGAEDQTRLAAMWSVVQGSVGNDPFVMVDMAARYARLALNTGSSADAARGLSMEAYMASFDGPGTRAKTEPIMLQAESLARAVSQNELTGWVRQIRGCVLAHEGRFAEAQPVLQDALEWLSSHCSEVPFELAGTHLYTVNVANHLGEYARTSTTAPGIVENALRRGDQYLACGVVGFAAPAFLAHRGLADAGERIRQAKASYRVQSVYQWADYLLLLADLNLALYEGQPARGVLLAAQQWPALQRSQLLRMKTAFGLVSYYRAGCALAAARERSTGASEALAMVRHTAKRLNTTRLPHLPGWAAVLQAGLACEQGEPVRAAGLLQAATVIFDGTGLRLYSAAARRRQGQLMGNDAGRALADAGEAAMRSQGVIDLEATTEMLAPGCRRPGG